MLETATHTFIAPASENIEGFIKRWQSASGSERANYQLFLTELCTLLHLPQPEPASENTQDNGYVFERRVDIKKPDGSVNRGFIDLYRRGAFVLEAKQSGKNLDSAGWDKAMLRAQNQADQYVRALPVEEGRPPFIVVTDVGRSIELYAEFSGTGGTYVPFPDPGHHRIRLDQLRDEAIQQRLHRLWTDPYNLDPSRHAARVTREVSAKLAELARSLEQGGHDVSRVAHFLKRCLFTMFSEDVGLLPEESFTQLLIRLQQNPEHFPDAMRSLWNTMHSGGYEGQLMHKLRQFNGGLFTNIDPIPLSPDQIQCLIDAAKADWRYVEPAIFGTLLERALDPRERHKLGAHFTPRAYVERLVMPTLIEPLRQEWQTIQVAVETWLQQGKQDKAVDELRDFHFRLCNTRVLDPACGSGNFLYVALEHMKRLEGEVLNLMSDLQGGQAGFESRGLTVDPHQFLGMEINPRAAAIAEIVLWIGYLQWHFRIHGKLDIPDPVLKDFRNIQHKDALIYYDDRQILYDDNGQPVSIWDGISYKTSPTTGELIPDEAGRIPVYTYSNPRKAEWPEAEFIVGNPPYLGARRIRKALGDGYLKALRKTYEEIPEHADFVMYWWARAADMVGSGVARRFGLITTNSLRQSFSRKVVEDSFKTNSDLSIRFVVPDHPWVDSADGAAVRVTLTTVGADGNEGRIAHVIKEIPQDDGEVQVQMVNEQGLITPNLSIGADPGKAIPLNANNGIGCVGYQLTGKGFILSGDQAKTLATNSSQKMPFINPLFTGRDITQFPRRLYAIDLFGFTIDQVRTTYPQIYQWVLERVKPERDHNNRTSLRERWWIFGEARSTFRPALVGIENVFATSLTAKHRIFVSVPCKTICDSTTVIFASDRWDFFGCISSRVHVAWALAAGGRLGMGNDARYNKSRCFETFPFPELDDQQAEKIGQLAEQLDAHRKRQQAEFPDLTLTGMYNVLEKLRSEEPLTDKEKVIHQQGLVSILRELHDDLDRAVFAAYGWDDLAQKLVGKPGATTPLPNKSQEQAEAEEELLCRLVDLNGKRAAEEAKGIVRWLRPEYQAPNEVQQAADLPLEEKATLVAETVATGKQPWPKTIPEQVEVVQAILAVGPQPEEAIISRFKRKPAKAVNQVLNALQVLGRARDDGGQWSLC